MGALPHWHSVKKNMLGLMAKLVPNLEERYRQSLEQYKEVDWYGFQKLPIMQVVFHFVKFMESTGKIQGAQAKMLLRVMMEEFYALMSFQATGCRIIRPSPALVHELLDTEVTFKLVDIRPPWPFVYIALPRECNVCIPHFHSGCPAGCTQKESQAAGVYVTWAESGAATRAAVTDDKHLQEIGLDEKGEVVIKALDAMQGERMVKEADAYGDWFARFLAVARDGSHADLHNWSVHYFNMHWKSGNEEDAEGAFERFEGVYLKDDKKSEEPETRDARNRLFHLAANVFLYMSMPQEEGDIVWRPNEERERYKQLKGRKPSKWRRNTRERIYQEMPTEAWVVGQTVQVIDRTIEPGDNAPGTSGERGSPRTHWRRAHWTTRWVGPRDGEQKKVPRWIRAALVRGRGEAPESTTYVVGKDQA
jgi:hypothetical protein